MKISYSLELHAQAQLVLRYCVSYTCGCPQVKKTWCIKVSGCRSHGDSLAIDSNFRFSLAEKLINNLFQRLDTYSGVLIRE